MDRLLTKQSSTGTILFHVPEALMRHGKVAPRRACPVYDKVRRELWFKRKLVKRFRQPAPNQELILLAFEEQGWPERIEDPLLVVHGKNPKQHLRDACKNLNRCQRTLLLHFFTDGAKHVGWRAV